MSRLPTVTIKGREYFKDDRLREYRAVEDPHERVTFDEHEARALPPDPDGMNEERAEWADAAVSAFQAETRVDLEDALCDLLADLMHWSDRNGFDFDNELRRARDHYDEETTPDPENGPVVRYCDDCGKDRVLGPTGLCHECEAARIERDPDAVPRDGGA